MPEKKEGTFKKKSFFGLFIFNRYEILFLLIIYLFGLFIRLAPRLAIDPHLLTFQGDIWYRLALAQYVLDNHWFPTSDLRYQAYGYVPIWYPPLSPLFFALTSYITGLDIPTVSSRIVPFIEAVAPLSLYPLTRYLYNNNIAFIATIYLTLTPPFIFWSGISDPQSITLFVLPLLIMLWVFHSESRQGNSFLLFMGLILALNFLLHLSYFLEVLILLITTIALYFQGKGRELFLDLGKVVLISQLLTMPWWLPHNLYWWWINALVTSSGLLTIAGQFDQYGLIAALTGIVSFAFLIKKPRRHALIILWAIPLFIETQNEVILSSIGRIDLSWYTMVKPLEGFRFYCFIAQPVAISVGVAFTALLDKVKEIDKIKEKLSNRLMNAVQAFLFSILIFFLLFGLYQYNMPLKLQTHGLTTGEYEAALWYRTHSSATDRIIADYYRSQMIAGVCGGKALLGGMFPLRNVDYPYISVPAVVQDDIYVIYATKDPQEAYKIAKKYGCTHIFYSKNMILYGNLLSNYKMDYGIDFEGEKFKDDNYFETVYNHDDVTIIRLK